jgi:hypothetical protein
MNHPLFLMSKPEALKEIQQTAEMILTKSEAPAVRVRLLRDILHRPHDDPELVEAKEQLETTEWVRLLAENQHQTGYFHHRMKPQLRADTFTTCFGIALDIGLGKEHPILAKAKAFAEWCLSEGVLDALSQMDPSPPGNPDRSVFELNLAAMLAQLDNESLLVEEVYGKWLTIAGVALLESGKYDREAQKRVTTVIFSPDYNLGHSVRYMEWVLATAAPLLAARPDLLDPDVDEAYARWYVHERHEINRTLERISSPSCRPSHRSLFVAGMLLDMESLYGFRNWGVHIEEIANYFWRVRPEDGLWNFGSACANPYFTTRIRLSDGWQGKRGAHDWTTRILLLLQKYYESNH